METPVEVQLIWWTVMGVRSMIHRVGGGSGIQDISNKIWAIQFDLWKICGLTNHIPKNHLLGPILRSKNK